MTTFKLLFLLFTGLTATSNASISCGSLLETSLQTLRTAEKALQDPNSNVDSLIETIRAIPIEKRLDAEFSWFLAKAYNQKGDLRSINKAYEHLQFLMNHLMSRVSPSTIDNTPIPDQVFIEAYLHLRTLLGINSFNSGNQTDQNFIILTSELQSRGVGLLQNFDPANWGALRLNQGN